ncbi:putative FAD-binding oxidoreductase [Xylariaceae sp. FL0804]|nr:putative FAD-binding oxidoreductase [Xylariaceae sp. FL0804]
MARSIVLTGLIALASLTSQAAADAADTACRYLERTLAADTVLPSQEQYTNLTEENWVQTAWASPTCIVQPSTAEELSRAVKHFVAANVSFAIRSGGHSPVPGGANIDDGVLVDMSSFDAVEYDAAASVAVVGSGLRWADVYSALDPYNVTVVGGRIVDVGVGGLTLGSGLSYLSDLYGLVCDNVVNFEVVLANGNIVNANASSNPDLWWALKGGANNFGIVTKFSLRTYAISQVWGGVKAYTLEQLPALYAAMLEYQTAADKDPYANLMMQSFPLNGSLGVVLNMVYLKPVASPPAFAPFYDIPAAADTTALQPLSSFLASQQSPDLPRLNWFATSFRPSGALYARVQDIVAGNSSEMRAIAALTAGSTSVGWQPISASLVAAGNARGNGGDGGNALGLQATNQTWMVIDVGWWDAADDAAANAATEAMIRKIEDAARAAGEYVEYIFMNDASVAQPVIAHYGAASNARLRDVQRRYDPSRVFQELVPGGFKLPAET